MGRRSDWWGGEGSSGARQFDAGDKAGGAGVGGYRRLPLSLVPELSCL